MYEKDQASKAVCQGEQVNIMDVCCMRKVLQC